MGKKSRNQHAVPALLLGLVAIVLFALVAKRGAASPILSAWETAAETRAPARSTVPASPDPAAAKKRPEPVSVPILMYHSIDSDASHAGTYTVTPETFRSDMEYLRDHGYTAVFTSDLYAYETKGTPLPAKPVMISLDDGYLNNLSTLPSLKDSGMKAVISVVGAFTQRDPGPHARTDRYACLNWGNIRTLHDSGLVEIGNHSWGMHSNSGPRKGAERRSNESMKDYCWALGLDLRRLQDALTKNSGVTPEVFAFPFGDVDNEAVPVLKSLGIVAAFSCEDKIDRLTGDPKELFHLGRINRPSGISTEEFMKRLQPSPSPAQTAAQ